MQIREVTTPIMYDENEIALMTIDEFLKFRNKDDEFHPSDSYDFDLVKMNQDHSMKHLMSFNDGKYSFDWIGKNSEGYAFFKGYNREIIAFVVNDTLYRTFKAKIRLPFSFSTRYGEEYNISASKTVDVKYLEDYIDLINPVARKNKEAYPVLLNHIKLKGEQFSVRTETTPYVKNSGKTIVILNSNGYVVAQGSDEWGATLLTVAQEYRNYGLGKAIGKYWYANNPKYPSGGFTVAGQRNAINIWADRVRNFLDRGWYSELVKEGKITAEHVRNILKGLPERKKAVSTEVTKEKVEPLFYIDEGSSFIIYDKKIFDNVDKKYIYAHGFFRENASGDLYLYEINYDKQFRKIANYVALQMARNEGFQIFIKSPPSDFVNFTDMADVEITDEFASLTDDVFDLQMMARIEATYRNKHDKYSEVYYQIQELADSKWD